MTYKPNPKTIGSGIITAIPQTGECPIKCDDCFFQSGRSYLEPLEENLPNLPDYHDYPNSVVRVNDGNDSNNNRAVVITETRHYKMRFYNTSIYKDLSGFVEPVVLTINPGTMTDSNWTKILPPDIPKNLMFVRFRVNTWNLHFFEDAVFYYAFHGVPIVATFLAYYDEQSIPVRHRQFYSWRQRTLNPYFAIRTQKWREIMNHFNDAAQERWVHSCGIEGIETKCRFCGNCLREYFATKERMRG